MDYYYISWRFLIPDITSGNLVNDQKTDNIYNSGHFMKRFHLNLLSNVRNSCLYTPKFLYKDFK